MTTTSLVNGDYSSAETRSGADVELGSNAPRTRTGEELLLGAGDDGSIAGTLNLLYAVISFEEGDEPDWDGLRELFSKHARITRITPEGTDHMDPSNFFAMTRDLVDIGAYTSFYEFEVARSVQQFGDVAQVWSRYETRRNKDAREALGRGVNSIQLVRENGTWRVLGLLWDETHADSQLDFIKIQGSV